MPKFVYVAAMLGLCSMASAQDILLTAHVQWVVLLPSGAPDCPPLCPTKNKNGQEIFCISNAGGCQTMEVKVDHIYRGGAAEVTRKFSSRIGEFGRNFPSTNGLIVINEEGGNVSWSYAEMQDGKIFFDPKSIRSIGGVATAETGNTEMVAIDDTLARVNAGR